MVRTFFSFLSLSHIAMHARVYVYIYICMHINSKIFCQPYAREYLCSKNIEALRKDFLKLFTKKQVQYRRHKRCNKNKVSDKTIRFSYWLWTKKKLYIPSKYLNRNKMSYYNRVHISRKNDITFFVFRVV